ncbi:hypothetical protein PanWU01x14_265100, partial [Parasponia andersonii]
PLQHYPASQSLKIINECFKLPRKKQQAAKVRVTLNLNVVWPWLWQMANWIGFGSDTSMLSSTDKGEFMAIIAEHLACPIHQYEAVHFNSVFLICFRRNVLFLFVKLVNHASNIFKLSAVKLISSTMF